MSGNTSPIFPAVPHIGSVSVIGASALTARTAITGTTGLTSLNFAAGSNGSRVDLIRCVSTGTTLAGNIGIWIYDATTSRLYCEIAIAATTVSTVLDYEVERAFSNLVLPSGSSLYASSQVASQLIGIHVLGGDF